MDEDDFDRLLGADDDAALLFDLDSLVADLADQGLLSAATGEPVVRASFDEAVAGAAGQAGPEGALARLLTALGRSRASTAGTDLEDPMWGEPRLDALQFVLLGAALAAIEPADEATRDFRVASLALVPPQSRVFAAGAPPAGGLGGQFRASGRQAFLSLTWAGCAAKHALYTSVLPEALPADLWHQNGRDPFTGAIRFTLVRRAIADFAWSRSGCPIPDRGHSIGPYDAIPGRSVSWQSDDAADRHGKLSNYTFTTTQGGEVEATYTTIRETTPQAEQIPANEASEPVAFTIEVAGLVPGMPSTLMVKPKGTKSLTVHWYEAGYRLIIDMDFVGTNDGYAGNVRVHGELKLVPDSPGAITYTGEGQLSFTTDPHSGPCKFVWSGKGLVDAAVQTTIPNPLDATTFEVFLGLDLGNIPKDTVTATGCGGPGGVTSDGKLSLLTLFYLGTWPTVSPTSPTIQLNGWHASTDPGVLLARDLASSCGIPAICQMRGELRLER